MSKSKTKQNNNNNNNNDLLYLLVLPVYISGEGSITIHCPSYCYTPFTIIHHYTAIIDKATNHNRSHPARHPPQAPPAITRPLLPLRNCQGSWIYSHRPGRDRSRVAGTEQQEDWNQQLYTVTD